MRPSKKPKSGTKLIALCRQVLSSGVFWGGSMGQIRAWNGLIISQTCKYIGLK